METKDERKMSKIPNNKIKIGVHWKNSVAIGTTYSNSPRHPKLIELDPVCIYFYFD